MGEVQRGAGRQYDGALIGRRDGRDVFGVYGTARSGVVMDGCGGFFVCGVSSEPDDISINNSMLVAHTSDVRLLSGSAAPQVFRSFEPIIELPCPLNLTRDNYVQAFPTALCGKTTFTGSGLIE